MDAEAALVEKARKGSTEAFSQLVRLHQTQLRAYLARYIRNREALDDLAQETFFGAYRSLAGYRGDSSFRLWLLGIARNQALMHFRMERQRGSVKRETFETALGELLVQDLEEVSVGPSTQEREVDALRGCLKKLPGTSAGLVHEHYFGKRSAGEIGRRSGKTSGAVWMTLLRIRQALRRCVEERLAVPEAGRE